MPSARGRPGATDRTGGRRRLQRGTPRWTRLSELYTLDVLQRFRPGLERTSPRTTMASVPRQSPLVAAEAGGGRGASSTGGMAWSHDLAGAQRLAHLVGSTASSAPCCARPDRSHLRAADVVVREPALRREWVKSSAPDGYGVLVRFRRLDALSPRTRQRHRRPRPPGRTSSRAMQSSPWRRVTQLGAFFHLPDTTPRNLRRAGSSSTRGVPAATAARTPDFAPDKTLWCLPIGKPGPRRSLFRLAAYVQTGRPADRPMKVAVSTSCET